MNISYIYQIYDIPPDLQEHQIRVAAVGLFILENLEQRLSRDDENSVIEALLLHDMGNFARYDLKRHPVEGGPKDKDWAGAQKKFRKNYCGRTWFINREDANAATYKIAEYLKLNEDVIKLIKSIGFENAVHVFDEKNLLNEIAVYADQRVTRNGIRSLLPTIEKGRVKYESSMGYRLMLPWTKNKDLHMYEKGKNALVSIEGDIASRMKINPRNITDEMIAPYISRLQNYSIRT